jgi:hypothetical protein
VTAWTTLPLAANWAAFGSGYAPPQYAKDSLGFVYLRGLATWTPASSPVNSALATMPVGYRISVGTLIWGQVNIGSASPCRVDLQSPGGTLQCVGPIPNGPNAFVSLSGISWWADS